MTSKLYIPLIRKPGIGEPPVPDPEPTPEPPIEPHVPVSCGMSIQETAIFDLLVGHPEQRRKDIKCDVRLVRAARFKAEEMARLNYFSHTSPDGVTPNQLVMNYGYPLPYGDGNNVESIAAGFARGVDVWEGWLASAPHRAHVLGELNFFAEQTRVGVGYAHFPDSPYHRYWCLLTAPE